MDSVKTVQQRVVYYSAGVLVLLLVIWFFTQHQKIVAGIFLGICVSLYNVLYLMKKIRMLGENIFSKKLVKYRGIGMIHRYLMVALAILFAVNYSAWFDVRAIAAGLPFCYILVSLLEFLDTRHSLFLERKE